MLDRRVFRLGIADADGQFIVLPIVRLQAVGVLEPVFRHLGILGVIHEIREKKCGRGKIFFRSGHVKTKYFSGNSLKQPSFHRR